VKHQLTINLSSIRSLPGCSAIRQTSPSTGRIAPQPVIVANMAHPALPGYQIGTFARDFSAHCKLLVGFAGIDPEPTLGCRECFRSAQKPDSLGHPRYIGGRSTKLIERKHEISSDGVICGAVRDRGACPAGDLQQARRQRKSCSRHRFESSQTAPRQQF
jgi:hypothetical protein